MSMWKSIQTEAARKVRFISNPSYCLVLHNVTGLLELETFLVLKCDEGVIYLNPGDIQSMIAEYPRGLKIL